MYPPPMLRILSQEVMSPKYQSALPSIFSSYSNPFAKPTFYRLNYLLYEIVLLGMGYPYYYSLTHSGEKPFLRRLESFYSSQLSCVDGTIVTFDVGAHHGSYSFDVLESFSRRPIQLHCFEPLPASFAQLKQALYGHL